MRVKSADLKTELQPHQQRVIDKLKASGGVLVAHGLGSGKTLTSIAAADELGLPIDAVVPAPLQENYVKEMKKHLGSVPRDARVRSYQRASKDKDINQKALVVLDEAHRARNSGTQISKEVAGPASKADYRLLLTGTPVYNQASDLAPLLNTAAGRRVLPDDPTIFKKTFIGEKTVQAPLYDRIKGRVLNHPVDTVTIPTLVNRGRLVDIATGYVDVHKGGGEGFPERIDETHEVPMSSRQKGMYDFHSKQMPWFLRSKIQAGLPLTKQESANLNSFQGALRQVSNTPRPYLPQMTDDEEDEHAPKIRQMVSHLVDMHKKDPNFRGVAYSNYLDGGLKPMSRMLTKAGVPHHIFSGEVPKAKRDQMVRDYNEGKVPVLLLSGAGSEGLDLKGTKAIQLMEPHWNDARIEQVIGRGIRYKSHDHLPEAERKVRVMRYYSQLPKDLSDRAGSLIGEKPKQSIEQYLRTTSEQKNMLSSEIAKALQEASDRGPRQKHAVSDEWITKRVGNAVKDRKVTYERAKAFMRRLSHSAEEMLRKDRVEGLDANSYKNWLNTPRGKLFQQIDDTAAFPQTVLVAAELNGWTAPTELPIPTIRPPSKLPAIKPPVAKLPIPTIRPPSKLPAIEPPVAKLSIPPEMRKEHRLEMDRINAQAPNRRLTDDAKSLLMAGAIIGVPAALAGGLKMYADARERRYNEGLSKEAAVYRMGDTGLQEILQQLHATPSDKKGRKRNLRFDHPLGFQIESQYDPAFMEKAINEQFGGNVRDYTDRIHDDLLNAGYAAKGDVAKKNAISNKLRAGRWAAYGVLGATVPSMMVQGRVMDPLMSKVLRGNHGKLVTGLGIAGSFGAGLTAAMGTNLAAGSLGWQLARATERHRGLEDVVAKNTHPLLQAPKEVKEKTKVEFKG